MIAAGSVGAAAHGLLKTDNTKLLQSLHQILNIDVVGISYSVFVLNPQESTEKVVSLGLFVVQLAPQWPVWVINTLAPWLGKLYTAKRLMTIW